MIVKRTKKAQYSMEYLLIFTLIFSSMIPIIFILYNSVSPKTCDTVDNQINYLGKMIKSESQKVYGSSFPSRDQVTLTIPRGITNITLYTNDSSKKLFNQRQLLINYSCHGSHSALFDIGIPINFSNKSNFVGSLRIPSSKGTRTIRFDTKYGGQNNNVLYVSLSVVSS